MFEISPRRSRQLVLRFVLLLTMGVFLPPWSGARAENSEANIAQLCHEEWPNDFSMEEYCQKNQREDLQAFRRLVAQYRESRDFIDAIVGRCTQEWTKGSGLIDYSMVDYCTRNEVEAAQRLGKAPAPSASAGAGATDVPAEGEMRVVTNGDTVDTYTGGSGAAIEQMETGEGSLGGQQASAQPVPVERGSAPRLTFGDLILNWKRYIGKRVVVVSAQVSQASRDKMLISGEGGEFWVREPRRKEDARYLVKNCSGKVTSERCLMPMNGVVRQYGTDLVMVFPVFETPD